jgi:hypothetical protein
MVASASGWVNMAFSFAFFRRKTRIGEEVRVPHRQRLRIFTVGVQLGGPVGAPTYT